MVFYIVALASLLLDAMFGISEKYLVTRNDEDAPLKIFIWFNIWASLWLILMYATESSESGMLPWAILQQMPAICLAAGCTILYMLLCSQFTFYKAYNCRNYISFNACMYYYRNDNYLSQFGYVSGRHGAFNI